MIDKSELKKIVNKKYARYGYYRVKWGVINYMFIFIPILFSGIAAVLLKLEILADWPFTTDIAAGLAGISAITAGFRAKIDAKRKLNASSAAKRKTESFRHQLIVETDLADDQLREIKNSIDDIYAKWDKEFGYSSG